MPRLSLAGALLSIAALWWVVLSGRSGLPASGTATELMGLALLTISGSSITISLLYSKRLHDRGISAGAVTAVRYLLLILVENAAPRRGHITPSTSISACHGSSVPTVTATQSSSPAQR